MMLNKKIQDAFNDQLNWELYSGYVYSSMATWFESIGLKGMAGWMHAQAAEERAHADKFAEYINDRGGRVLLKAIAAPPTQWKSPVDAFEDAGRHEADVTERIHKLVDLAAAEKDHASSAFLQWFVTEQVEEEASVDKVVEHLKMVADSRHGLFMMNRELGAR